MNSAALWVVFGVRKRDDQHTGINSGADEDWSLCTGDRN